MIVEALGDIADTRSVPSIVSLIGDSDPGVRAAVATSLGKRGGARFLSDLLQLARDDDFSVRYSAQRAILALQDDPGVLDYLVASGGSDDKKLARAAIEILGETKDRRAVQTLIDLAPT